MTRLKELRLHGFKTFADPTRFVFEPGVNAVIGPNGSGKSNMADGVRWVLGEQSNRGLRTRRADDVIFAGSEQRRALGMAEAVLVLDNAEGWLPIDYSEVSIARRAYRSGESEYLINGAKARLRDVVALLAGGRLAANELVVVGQGTVDAALSLRPEDRRQLFEEAAGVKNLQVRKNEALGRLDRARANLARVGDLLSELRPQVRRLALQASHQQEHEALVARARALIEATHRRTELGVRDLLGDARRAAAAADSALDRFRAEQDAGRAAVEEAESRYWEAERSARTIGEQREATREAVVRLEARLEAVGERLAALESALSHAEGELREMEAAERPPAANDDEVARLVAVAAEAESRCTAAVETLDARDAALIGAEEALAGARRRRGEQVLAETRRAEADARAVARRDAIAAELDAARRLTAEAEETAREAERASLVAMAAGDEARLRDAEVRRTASEARTAADAARQEAANLAERIGALRAEEQAVSEAPDGTAHLGRLLSAAGWPSLVDRLDAPSEAWPAIEAAVGGALDDALLWQDADPLDRLAAGRGAAHLVVATDGLADGTTDPRATADRQRALDAVSGHETVAERWGLRDAPRALQRAVVAPDVAALLRGWAELPPGWCAVSLEGDLADSRGVITIRGRLDAGTSRSAQRRLRHRELVESIAGLELDEQVAATAAARAHGAVAEAERALEAVLAKREEAERNQAAAAAAAASASERAHGARQHELALQAELDGMMAPLEPAPDARVGSQPIDRLDAELTVARARREEARVARDEARETWRTAQASAAEAERRRGPLPAERAMHEARRAQLRQQAEQLQRETDEARASADGLRDELAGAQAADAAAAEARRAADEARESLRSALLATERQVADTGRRLAELEAGAQRAAVEVTRHEESLASLTRERQLALDAIAEANPSSASAPPAPVELEGMDAEALDAELRRVRRTLAQLGSVNPFAVEEHRELAARQDALAGQQGDLSSAIGSTEELIERLDREIAGRFDAAFTAIGTRFDDYCRLLFGGGSASLQMAEAADGDAPAGIEIAVRPPGKRLQRLAMLSGGERALTGVALLFAMLDVNPVPFCILDEVDAALDEANIGRFAAALRELASRIDFVVITHNRATIEIADTIYGVTMSDAAVSRVISLRLADVPVAALSG